MYHLTAFAPLLAVDLDTLIPILIAVGWLISVIVKMASGQAQKGPPVANRPRAPARPRDDKLQQEIDIFIQEVSGRKPSRPTVATPTGSQKPAPKPPVKAPPATPAAKAALRGATPPKALPPARPARPPRRVKPGAEMASRQAPVSSGLGNHVRQHLKDYMAEKVSVQVAEDLGAPQPATAPAPVAEPKFVELLRSPANLRQAMVLNLILAPPPARSRRT
ncbi:MAG: hypothetical protein ACT4QC_06965 [Planctomycetaceae bacterium]